MHSVVNGRDNRASLTGEAVAVYKAMVADPAWSVPRLMSAVSLDRPALRTALRTLAGLQLVRPSLDRDREWDAVSPECALAELLASDEAELHRRQAELAGVRSDILSLLPAYLDASRAGPDEIVDVVDGAPTIRRMLAAWSRRTEQEVLVAHPGGGLSEDSLARGLLLELPVLDRGVRMRTLLHHSTRRHRPTRHYVETVTGSGAAIRTVSTVPGRMIMFDRSVAFIPVGGSSTSAALVRASPVVDYLLAVFDSLWVAGRPYLDDSAEAEEAVHSDERQVLLRHLASGVKDDVVARRLGMSVRTCRRHIAAVMSELGADSRFQAGLLAYRAGLFDDGRPSVGEGAPADGGS